MTQAAAGPNDDMEIGARIIPEEPMAIVSLVPLPVHISLLYLPSVCLNVSLVFDSR